MPVDTARLAEEMESEMRCYIEEVIEHGSEMSDMTVADAVTNIAFDLEQEFTRILNRLCVELKREYE